MFKVLTKPCHKRTYYDDAVICSEVVFYGDSSVNYNNIYATKSLKKL